MPKLRRRGATFALVAVGLFGGFALIGPREREPTALSVDSELAAPTAHVGYLVVPDAATLPTVAQHLEQRLQAFAAAVEAYQRRAPRSSAPVEFDTEGLEREIASVVSVLSQRAQVSIHVRDLFSDAVLFDYFGDTPLNPASNQKLVTASAALDLLGDDYVFETRFHVEDDVLYAVGGGDPFLDAAALSTIAVRLDAHVSIASLSRLVVDDRAFSNSRFGPGYETGGVGESYQAPSGALSLEFNTVQVTVYAVAGSRRAGVSLFPASDHVRLHNRALVGGRKTRVSIRSEPQGDHTLVQVSGRLAEHAPPVVERRRIYDPARYTGGALAAELAEISGTEPLPVEPGEVPFGVDPVWVHESPPLLEIVDGGLAYSNNFVAEQLLRTLGWRLTGQPGDWENGNEVLSGYWSALGLDPQALHFINGSGFSLEGRMTTSGLVDLIGVSHRVQGTGAGLLAALPVAGEEGSLRARLRQSGKRVRAKTGTLDGVSGLSGVITAEDGTGQVAFSILINVKPGTMPAATRRDAADRIVMAVLHYVDDYESRRGFLRFEPMWVRAGTDAGTPAGTGAGAPGAVAASPG